MKLHIKKHWRIWLLALFIVVSTAAIFAPAGGAEGEADIDGDQPTASQYTNLQFGLELSGGTQVRAPPVGMTVTGLNFEPDDERDIERTVQEQLDVGAGDVRADFEAGTVEVFDDDFVGNTTQAEFAAALSETGLDVSEGDVRMGVSADTRDRTEETLQNKINEGGLAGGTASQVAQPGAEHFMLVEVPGANRTEVIDLIGERGQVEIVALFPDPDTGEMRTVPLLDQSDLAEIGGATQSQGDTFVPVTLTPQAGEEFGAAMREYGFDQEGGTTCRYDLNMTAEENFNEGNANRCLLTVVDGEVVFGSGIASGLSASFRSGDFDRNPSYRTLTTDLDDARELELNMRAGALPTNIDIENRGTVFFLQPSLAERFKPLSLATGATAIFAVAFMVFLRYRKPRVAAPMLLTAGSEVYILLGFAALVGLPLDLSHIAGFIAVIGTGVDDLVIIADEIMQQGEVRTSRVFESRFKKAFWVIGAAAATTIIAMSPLAVLSLGDLRGFAIITIIGVLVGVLITRPAYGDILRILVLDEGGGGN